MSKAAVETTALATREEYSNELAPTSAAAAAQFEIQSAMAIAQRFPRNEDAAFAKLRRSCQRTSFAEQATYSFPRGGATIKGPSVNIAREGARCWGNMRHGLDVIRDDDESRQIRGWAWDLETNVKVAAEDEFRKLIFRKNAGWIVPDERELRELTNRRGAILVRNSILQLLPSDLIEDALAEAKKTLESGAAQDPDGERKKIVAAFADLNVTPQMLESKLGHPLIQASPAEIAELRRVFVSIRDGQSKWTDYLQSDDDEAARKAPARGKLDVDDLKASTAENRGHGNEGLGATSAETAPAEARSAPTERAARRSYRKRGDAAPAPAAIPEPQPVPEVAPPSPPPPPATPGALITGEQDDAINEALDAVGLGDEAWDAIVRECGYDGAGTRDIRAVDFERVMAAIKKRADARSAG